MKRLRITIGEKVYDVAVETLDAAGNPEIASAAPVSVAPVSAASVSPVSASSAPASVAAPKAAAGPGVVTSPLGGNVVQIQVKTGQAVQEGDQLVVLEAMKMNTYIYAPESGKIAEVFVEVGQAVQEGQSLVRIGE
jgi:biotin carboxyl carrier protein